MVSRALLVLPLAAFFVGPIISAIGEGGGSYFTLSVLPTVLPITALVLVAAVVRHRTASTKKAAVFTATSLLFLLVGAGVYLLIVWPHGG